MQTCVRVDYTLLQDDVQQQFVWQFAIGEEKTLVLTCFLFGLD